ncbi:hypothetical protein M407DRAFT_17810 [Tulasnella calospora MUT 4182]|uniref:Uncharacterized protein n=1 Tax=Tulasnella calospora MUT 4182 TaxID=1051891 RepID=A0A0C3QKX1_9AGAM|nr:hypothetical protein M407DRAFT_17810 [Tulasnella calospora MUT 4182]
MELRSIRDLWIQEADISPALLGYFQKYPGLEKLVILRTLISPTARPITTSFHSLKHFRYEARGLRQSVYCLSTFVLPQLETLHTESVFLSEERGSCDHRVFQFNPTVLQELTIQPIPGWSQSTVTEAGPVELLKRTTRIKSLKLSLDEFSSRFSLPGGLISELQTLLVAQI